MSSSPRRRVVVLGADGMDPGLLDELIAAGRLPTLERLAGGARVSRLATSCPVASPVAWSSFISGKNPAGHGIYDFLERDRLTYMPRLALSRVKKRLFGLPTVVSNRRGGAFWEKAAERGLTTSLMFLPVTFPPPRQATRVLTGLGTPDLRGSWGTYSVFSTRLGKSEETMMGGMLTPITMSGDAALAALEGPLGRTVDLRLRREARSGVDGIEISLQGRSEWVPVGAFSGWFEIGFRVFGPLRAWGICRFHVLSAGKDVELYCSPVNLHPGRPPLPVSAPRSLSREVFARRGFYKTLGWDMDTWALEEGHLTEGAFLTDLRETIGKRREIILDEVRRNDTDVQVGVLQETDLVQHVFWRYRHGEPGTAEARDAIAGVYAEVDRLAADILALLEPEDLFLLVSDHGFGGFHRAVNLNSFLRNSGMLQCAQTPGAALSVATLSPGRLPVVPIEWGRTRAYSYGLGNIWLNVRGREGRGIVEEGRDYVRTREAIVEALLALRDPLTDQAAVRSVYLREQVYSGPFFEEAPDLLVGFHDGFRVSWDTALGGVAPEVFSPNAGQWRGDHCSRDPAITPGVLLSNHELESAGASLLDLAPTILAALGCDAPPDYEGKSLLPKRPR